MTATYILWELLLKRHLYWFSGKYSNILERWESIVFMPKIKAQKYSCNYIIHIGIIMDKIGGCHGGICVNQYLIRAGLQILLLTW